MKTAKSYRPDFTADNSESAHDCITDTPNILVKIEGLRAQPGAGDFVFSLDGVKRRMFSMGDVMRAAELDPQDDEMCDAIGDAIWGVDLRRILVDRIKPA